MNVTIRRFQEEDAKRVSEIARRNFLEVNIVDYSEEEMNELHDIYDEAMIKEVAGYAHMYVVLLEDEIVGTGSISSLRDSKEESVMLSIFVVPELQGKGIGKKIIETLEKDELFLCASRIEVPSSITACEFYLKLGYEYVNGCKELDDEGLYRLEKRR